MIHFWPLGIGIIMAFLLTHVCVVETLDFSGTSMDLQVRKGFKKIKKDFITQKNMK